MEHTYQVGIKAVIVNKKLNKVLFLTSFDQNGTKILGFPGGRMEKGETIQDTLKREVVEEIKNIGNYTIKDILTANPRSFDLANGNGLFLVTVLVETEIDKPELSEEHNGFEWLSLSQLTNTLPVKISDAVLDNKTYQDAAIKALGL